MFTSFSASLRDVIFESQTMAIACGDKMVAPEHLVMAMLGIDCNGRRMLVDMGVALDSLHQALKDGADARKPLVAEDLILSAPTKTVIDLTYDEMRLQDAKGIGTGLLLIALLREGNSIAAQALKGAGVDFERARAALALFLVNGADQG